jgi:uncharacterized membrane protein YoaK (UPF0700 family)
MATVDTHHPELLRALAELRDSRPEAQSMIRDLLLVGLTFASGAVDAIAFLGLDKVFSAFMTGNFAFLGFVLAGSNDPDLPRVTVALAAFALGVFVAVRIVRRTRGSGVWPHRVSVALGVAVLAEAAFAAGWLATSGHPSARAGDLLIGLSALALGAQSGAIMSLDVKGIFTTAATATLIMLMSDEAGWSRSKAEIRRLAAVLVSLVAGAAAGAFLLFHARSYAPLLPLFAMSLVVATASFALQPSATAERR